MPSNVTIVTNNNYDCEPLVKSYSVCPENLNEDHFKHMVLERGYELAEESFKDHLGHDDFMNGPDEERGYTEHGDTYYIDGQYVVWYEEGEMKTARYFGDTHECWIKPEKDEYSNTIVTIYFEVEHTPTQDDVETYLTELINDGTLTYHLTEAKTKTNEKI